MAWQGSQSSSAGAGVEVCMGGAPGRAGVEGKAKEGVPRRKLGIEG